MSKANVPRRTNSWATPERLTSPRQGQKTRPRAALLAWENRQVRKTVGILKTWPKFTNPNRISQSKTKQAAAQSFRFPFRHRALAPTNTRRDGKNQGLFTQTQTKSLSPSIIRPEGSWRATGTLFHTAQRQKKTWALHKLPTGHILVLPGLPPQGTTQWDPVLPYGSL